MIHLGDITKIHGDEIEPVDCIVGGSPCQDVSCAGKRAGIQHSALGSEETTRSGLFMEQVRIIREMRERDIKNGRTDIFIRPRYAIWENVPGAFSSAGNGIKGADFAAVLTEFVRCIEPEAPDIDVPAKGWTNEGVLQDELGNWSIAWAVHDLQYWGTTSFPTPQRRRRISVVCDFGGPGARALLSLPESMYLQRWNNPCACCVDGYGRWLCTYDCGER